LSAPADDAAGPADEALPPFHATADVDPYADAAARPERRRLRRTLPLSFAAHALLLLSLSLGTASLAPEAWRSADLAAHRVHATVSRADGSLRYARDGEGRALLGDPRTALTWLANELSALGIGLRAGDWASCGTCMVPLAIEPGDRVVADYGAFGTIALGLSD